MTIDDELERVHKEVIDALKHFERVRRIILYFIAIMAIIVMVYGTMSYDFLLFAVGGSILIITIALSSEPEETGDEE